MTTYAAEKRAADRAPRTLGTDAESIHAEASPRSDRERRAASNRVRFDLLRDIQGLLWNPGAAARDQHRTAWCHRAAFSSDGQVTLHRSTDGRGRLGGVQTCANVWTCPVCCARIAETRRRELTAAMLMHRQDGGAAYLLTFTFPHDVSGRLADQLPALAKARQRFQNSRAWKAWIAEAKRVGAVTSLEVTYGSQGWHPHLHMLVFCRPGAFGEAQADPGTGDLHSLAILNLHSLWVSCLQAVGLCDRSQVTDAMKHAFNVRGGEKAAEYVAKYGSDAELAAELTASHAKMGRRRLAGHWHATPFQLVQLVADGRDELIPAWHEYVDAFAGKRMLTWTPGLKAHFGIAELTDDDLAAQGIGPQAEETQVATLDAGQFRAVLGAAALGRLIEFVALRVAGDDGQAQVDAWIARHCQRARVHDDMLRRMTGSCRMTAIDSPAPVEMTAYH